MAFSRRFMTRLFNDKGVADPASESWLSFTDVGRAFGADVLFIDASTLTITDDHHGKLLAFRGVCTVTIPTGLRVDFSCGWSQETASAITFVAGGGATVQSLSGSLSSGGQYAVGGLTGIGGGPVRLSGQLA